MKKYIFLIIIILLSSKVFSATHYVNQAPDFEFVTIQSAINIAVDGDSVIVYPGIYYENIDFLRKSIYLGSLYTTTADTTYIRQTIIDGQRSETVILCYEVVNATIEGFTVQHGSGVYTEILEGRDAGDSYYAGRGGGVKLLNIHTVGHITLSNNHIRNNKATEGGGLFIRGTNVHLKRNYIYNNSAINSAGGIQSESSYYYCIECGDIPTVSGSISFDSIEKNSVYCNVAKKNNDILFIYFFSEQEYFDIPLKKTTYSHNNYFDIARKDRPFEYITTQSLNISFEEVVIEEVDADLYVSPNGNDSNSGLSPADPLKTITMALFKSKGSVDLDPDYLSYSESSYTEYTQYINSLDIKTIYVANGLYNEESGNIFPFRLKNMINIIGESQEHTIIDAGGKNSIFISNAVEDLPPYYPGDVVIDWNKKFVTIKNFTLQNIHNDLYFYYTGFVFYSINRSPIFYPPENEYFSIIKLHNIKSENTLQAITSGASTIVISGRSTMIELKNLYLKRTHLQNVDRLHPYAIDIYGSKYNFLVNIIIDGGQSGITLRNMQNYHYSILSNLLITNLVGSQSDIFGRIYALFFPRTIPLSTREPNVIIINSTFTNNTTPYGLIMASFQIYLNIYNSIICGNNNNDIRDETSQIQRWNSILAYNLFEFSDSYLPHNPYNINNLYESDPLFNSYYMLSKGSPAINSGTINIPSLDLRNYYHNTNPFFASIPLFSFPEYDLAGNHMINDGQISMGAYQYIESTSVIGSDLPLEVTMLYGNYPNPFNPVTTISFRLKSSSFVSLNIYNIRGQKIKSVVSEYMKSGEHRFEWNGKDDDGNSVSSGIYLYRLRTDDYSEVKRMVLMK